MIQLLNRIALVLCLCIWLVVGSLLWASMYSYWGGGIILWLILWFILKAICFPHSYIESRVEHFAKVIQKRSSEVIHNTPVSNIENSEKNETVDTVVHEEDSQVWNKMPLEEHDDEASNVVIHDSISENKKNLALKQEKEETSSTPVDNFVSRFFSENILAKIGWLFVFLWVIFLLSLVWKEIPWVVKLMLGFIVSMSLYFAWVYVEKKWLRNEAMILMGIWILSNYAVILSWRHILWTTSIDASPLLSVGTSFVFLIFNTIFAVLTALNYKSSTLLIFALLFAYFNPIFVSTWETITPYVLVIYSLLVSAGALFLGHKKQSFWLIVMAFVLGNTLIAFAPNSWWDTELGYLTKHISLVILCLSSLLSAISLKTQWKYYIEILFAASFFICWFFGFLGWQDIQESYVYILNIITAFIFLFGAYAFIKKWPFLYTIWTIWTALSLLAHIHWEKEEFMPINILTVWLFAFLHIVKWYYLDIKKSEWLKNLVVWTVSWALFLVSSIYIYAQNFDHSIVFIGIIYLFTAILYFFLGYSKISQVEEKSDLVNGIYNYFWVALSFFSLSIALIFSDYNFVISIFWLFESLIIFYFFRKIGDIKIWIAWLLLMILWVIEFIYSGSAIWATLPSSFGYLAIVVAVLWWLGLWTIFSQKFKNEWIAYSYDFLHIIWFLSIWSLLLAILSDVNNSILYLILSILAIFIWQFYKEYGSKILNLSFLCVYSLLFISHSYHFLSVYHGSLVSLESTLLQYTISVVLSFGLISFVRNNLQLKVYSGYSYTLAALYLFVMTSLYVYHIFPSTFSVTLYWWALAFMLLHYGINKDLIRFRTLGLYLVILLCLKILSIDIATNISDGAIKIVAFMGVWVMLIIISLMYSKKYGNKLKWEFDPLNLWSDSILSSDDSTQELNETIEEIDTSDMQSVVFKPNVWKWFTTKSQNLMKITRFVLNDKLNAHFKAGELEEEYDYISKNYKSMLSKVERDRVEKALKSFVEVWGEVIIKQWNK